MSQGLHFETKGKRLGLLSSHKRRTEGKFIFSKLICFFFINIENEKVKKASLKGNITLFCPYKTITFSSVSSCAFVLDKSWRSVWK